MSRNFRDKLELRLLDMGITNFSELLQNPLVEGGSYGESDMIALLLQTSLPDVIHNLEIQEVFSHLGLTKNLVDLERMVEDLRSYYGFIGAMAIVIEYVAGLYPRLDIDSQFPINPTITDSAFTDNGLVIYNMTRVSDTIGNDILEAAGLHSMVDSAPLELSYHATSWRSARDIAIRGADRGYGRPNLDFGSGPSFYMTE